MPDLKSDPLLRDLQQYVMELEKERGFSQQNLIEKCLMLGEETGELFKAVRKKLQIKTDPGSKTHEVGDELTDILIYVCAIANRCNIDLEEAFRKKEEINKKRTWR